MTSPSSDPDECLLSDEEDDDEAKEARLKEVSAKLDENPYDYQSHVDKVDVLKKLGDLVGLREAREAFASLYPLSPELWLQWIADEKSLATSEDEKAHVRRLFERAVQDYVSVDVWLEFCQFHIGLSDDMQESRDIFERAVVAVGVWVDKGALIWEAYREYESLLASTSLQPDAKDRVDKLFRRQLSLPLMHMEKTYEEYSQWRQGSAVDANVDNQYQACLIMLRARLEFEDHLANESDPTEKWTTYANYLELEKKEGNPVRVQSLYERRINDFCLDCRAWLEFVDYLDSELKVASVSLHVHQRSIRNCPWSRDLWLKYIRALERFGQPQQAIVQCAEQALAAGVSGNEDILEIWLALIDYQRRQMDLEKEPDEPARESFRKLFARALEHLAPLNADPSCKVARYWAAVEGDRFRCMKEARKIWSDVLAVLGDQGRFWLELVQLEKMFGDSKHIRRLFGRALDRVQQDADDVAEAWLQFEREEGSLEQFEEAETKIRSRLPMKTEPQVDDTRDVAKGRRSSRKRPLGRHQDFEVEEVKEPVFKKPFQPRVAPVGDQKEAAAHRFVSPPPGYLSGVDEDKRDKTVFVSNLDYSADEALVRKTLESSGRIVEVRLVKKASGKSKGFAFVEFSSSKEAEHALQRDHEELQGRPMFVSKCDPDKKQKGHQFKYSIGLEKNKLFVKGLSRQTTKSQLEEVFGRFGKVSEVRLVTYRNGHSKGLAFIDFADEACAATALVKTDGTQLDGNVIGVALSNPPNRKSPDQPSPRCLGSANDQPAGPRGRGRSQVALVPRSVNLVSKNGSAPVQPKSNEDFRNLLLGLK